MVPQPLGCIEFGPVAREVVDLPPGTIGFEPGPHVMVFVIGRVVLDIDDVPGVIVTGDLLKKVEISVRIKHGVAMVQKAGRVEFDTAENLDTAACTGCGDLRCTSPPRPGTVHRRVLAKTGLVLINQGRASRVRFFLIRGYV